MGHQMPDDNVIALQRRQAQQIDDIAKASSGGGPPDMTSDSNERISRLEGALDGLRHNQTMLLAAVGLVLTVLLGFGFYGMNRFDRTDNRIEELPGKISSDIRDITRTLSEAITASKQQAPQVILLPAPQQPQQTTPSKQ
jgi:hypothetical protein